MPFEGYKRRDENSGYLQAGVVPKTTENADGTLTQHVNIDFAPTGTVVIASLPTGSMSINNFPNYYNVSGTVVVSSVPPVVISSMPTGTLYPISSSDLTNLIEARTQTPTKTSALNVQIGPGDVISKIPVVMLYDHHQLHEGEEFRWSTYASLGNGASKDIQLIVPNITITTNAVTQCPHFRFEFISSVGGDAYLYEGATFTATGTSRAPIAMERNGTYTPRLGIYEDPTVNAVGTQLWRGLLISGRVSAGNTSDSSTEFILKNNTSYLLRFTSAGATNLTLIRMIWYEDLGV